MSFIYKFQYKMINVHLNSIIYNTCEIGSCKIKEWARCAIQSHSDIERFNVILCGR